MNTDVKKEWIEALEFYDQAHSALKQPGTDRFCPLGVLCDLYKKETGRGSWVRHENFADKMEFRIDGEVSQGLLPPTVAEWAGLTDEKHKRRSDGFNPQVKYRGEEKTLTLLNDAGVPFDEIKEFIAKSL